MSGAQLSKHRSSNAVHIQGRLAKHSLGSRCFGATEYVVVDWELDAAMDLKHGNEKEAREKQNVWYHEVQCTWIKTIQRFVTSCMMVHGSRNNGSVSRLGRTVLEVMVWQDWRGLEENGTENIRSWLEEMGDMRGLRCPRLLVLLWLLAECLSSEEQGADDMR